MIWSVNIEGTRFICQSKEELAELLSNVAWSENVKVTITAMVTD